MAAPSRSKGEQTRRAILDAAIARFGREGYRATSVADIARDAGVGGTVAYAYFPSKEALFLAAIDEDAAGEVARDVWRRINGRNLREHILPTRERADLVLEKSADHSVRAVRLRKL